jgi:hypothetical protein
MKHLSTYLELGFARMTDYAVERLGLRPRRTQMLLQMGRRLRNLPDTARAFEAGRISQSQVCLLLRVATPENERTWIDKATGMNVRRLEHEVRRARAALGADGADASDTTTPPALDSDAAPAGDNLPASETAPAGNTAPNGDTAEATKTPATGDTHSAVPPANSAPIDEDSEEPLVQVTLPAPGWVRGRWEWAIEVFRRTAGAAAPVWEAAEGIAADYLSGHPGLSTCLDQPPDGAMTARRPDTALAEGTNVFSADLPDQTAGDTLDIPNGNVGLAPDEASICGQEDDGIDLFEEVQRALEEDMGGSQCGPSVSGFQVALPPDLGDDGTGGAASLDHRLRGLIKLRQTLAWHQGRLLRTFANYRLYRALGFASFSRYCRENLGMSVRRARQLIALERRLLELPDLARAYRDGELSWVKASEIARVADERTEKEWIQLGGSVTVRRLRIEVALAMADLDDMNAPWHARRGAPPGLTPQGQVQLCAPSVQRPPMPPSPSDGASASIAASVPDSPPDSAPDSLAGVQMCAPVPEAESIAGSTTATTPNAPEVQTCARPEAITTRIRFRAPIATAQVWRHALAACRAVEGNHLQDWECVAKMVESFRRTWDLRGSPAWQRRYRIFERDGWRCRVPGCSSRRNLHAHHVVFRSLGGGGEDDNLVTVCVTHHLRCLHAGTIRCHRLPEGLLAWELGSTTGGPAEGHTSNDDTDPDDTLPDDTIPGGRHSLDSPPADTPDISATGSADAPENGTVEHYVEDVLWAAARATARSISEGTPGQAPPEAHRA